jgi:hypothetical protein
VKNTREKEDMTLNSRELRINEIVRLRRLSQLNTTIYNVFPCKRPKGVETIKAMSLPRE